MVKYNKLVRDLIPKVIESSGKSCDYEKVNKKDLDNRLVEKLDEEVAEFKEGKNLEELADIMEVVFALANNLGYREEDLVKKREEKRLERGGFEEGIVLLGVDE